MCACERERLEEVLRPRISRLERIEGDFVCCWAADRNNSLPTEIKEVALISLQSCRLERGRREMSGISAWSWLVGGAVTGLLGYANLPMSWLASTQTTTATYLATAKLEPLLGAKSLERTEDLWRETGAVVMAVRRPG